MDDSTRDDLDDRLDELEAAVADLRDQIRPARGVPRPPRPREVLRFTDEYAIPAAIAALEANVRALELLRAGIRASDPERLDRALAEVESAIEGSGVPRNREARDLLVDARRLNEEVRDVLEAGETRRATGPDRDEAVRIEVEAEGDAGSDADADGADEAAAEVEAELETVRDEVASEAAGEDAEE